ncbi:MAG: hypothetical protein AB7O26_03040 [Planctomycetaceae bacterium]
MSARANVRSFDAIRRFRGAVVAAESDLVAVLGMLRQELLRTLEWLDHDRPAHWQHQARLCSDKLAAARTHLARRQMITVAGHRPECIEEKKELRLAKQRLEHAQEMIRVVRQWSIKAHRKADEYSCQIGRLEQALLVDIPAMRSLLDRILTALDAYADSAPQSVEESTTAPDLPAEGRNTQLAESTETSP